MATVQHDVTVSEQPANMHGFRHVVSCICGFMGRVGDKVKAEALAVKHATFHGIEYVPKKVVEEVKKVDTDANTPAVPSPNSQLTSAGLKSKVSSS